MIDFMLTLMFVLSGVFLIGSGLKIFYEIEAGKQRTKEMEARHQKQQEELAAQREEFAKWRDEMIQKLSKRQ